MTSRESVSSDGRDMMQDLAGYDSVHEVRVTPPIHSQEFDSVAELERAVGALTTEGVAASGADRWQEAGFYGQGVKIGIIDVGFGGYEELIGTELPALDRLQRVEHVGGEAGDRAVARVLDRVGDPPQGRIAHQDDAPHGHGRVLSCCG